MSDTVYGLYEIATGTLLSVGTIVSDPLPDGTATLALPDGAVAFVTVDWQAQPPAWVPKAPTPIVVMSRGDFMRRLTFDREVVLRIVMNDAATAASLRAQLQTLDAWLARASDVDVTDPITVGGVGLMAQVLDAQGALPEGIPAFTAAMLAPVTP